MQPDFRDYGPLCEADYTQGRPQPKPRYGAAGGCRVRPHATFWAWLAVTAFVAFTVGAILWGCHEMRAVDARCPEVGCGVVPE